MGEKFLGDAAGTQMGTKNVSGHRTGRVAVSAVVDSGDNCFIKVVFVAKRAIDGDGQSFLSDPALARCPNRVQTLYRGGLCQTNRFVNECKELCQVCGAFSLPDHSPFGVFHCAENGTVVCVG